MNYKGKLPELSEEFKKIIEAMSLPELREEKRSALSLLRGYPGVYLADQTRLELGFVNRCIVDLERCQLPGWPE